MMRRIAFEYKIVAAYLVIGGAWIIFSDRLLYALTTDQNVLIWVQIFKGWFYVIITAVLFYFYLKKHLVKIRAAEMKAKESDQLKTAFLQNISHEIRTPMNGIIGFAELLNRENLSEERKRKYINTIVASSQQLLNIVNDVLDISLIESGNISVKPEVVNINEILEEVYKSFKTSLTKNVLFSLEKGLPENQSVITTDGTKVRQILNNLLSNAIKFTKEGYIKMGYRLKGVELEFYVEDTGIGIAENLKERIFDRFTKAEVELTKQYGGTGLGLAICKGNVDLLHGKIWLESKLNEGSVFYFKIPYNPIKKDKPELMRKKSLPSFDKNRKVLIVEDEEINQLFIKEILERHGITTYYCKNGKEAIEFCKKIKDISLILMDIKLPVMNGYEAINKIREFKPDIIAIAETAFAMAEDRQIILNSGFNDYLAKPFDEDQFSNLLIKYLKDEK